MHKQPIGRRRAIPVICSFTSYLLSQLTGCGGGGGSTTKPSGQTSFTLTVPPSNTNPNLTALDFTRTTLAIDTDGRWPQYGQFVKTLGGQTFEAGAIGQHWKLYKNGVWVDQSADQLRLTPSDTIEWRLES